MCFAIFEDEKIFDYNIKLTVIWDIIQYKTAKNRIRIEMKYVANKQICACMPLVENYFKNCHILFILKNYYLGIQTGALNHSTYLINFSPKVLW